MGIQIMEDKKKAKARTPRPRLMAKKKMPSFKSVQEDFKALPPIPSEILPPNTEDLWTKAKPHLPADVEPKYSGMRPWTWKNRRLHKEWAKREETRKTNPDKIVLIRMEMNNGFFREFVAAEDNGSFIFKKAKYVLDMEQKYYIIERNIWAYDFHESLSLPIRKKIHPTEEVEQLLRKIEESYLKPLSPKVPVNEIKKIVESSNVVDVENSLNPTTLKHFVESEVIKQVLQGAMLGKIFKIMFVLIIIILIFVFLDTMVDFYASGIFDGIKNMLHKD